MAKLTLSDLKKLRDQKTAEMNPRDTANKTAQIIVGMGTCGIAAGAKGTFDAFIAALGEKKLDSVVVRQTGCMGLCHSEPTVEVVAPDMPTVIYGKVDAATARTIVEQHILGKQLVGDHIIDKPSTDILRS